MANPRDDQGRFIPLACDDPDCDGRLMREQDGWRCNGLVDPNNPNKELQACARFVIASLREGG